MAWWAWAIVGFLAFCAVEAYACCRAAAEADRAAGVDCAVARAEAKAEAEAEELRHGA